MAGKATPATMASPAKQARTHAHRHGRSPLFSSPGPRYDPVCFLARLITSTSTSQKRGDVRTAKPSLVHTRTTDRAPPDSTRHAPRRHPEQPISATQHPHPDEPPRILCRLKRARSWGPRDAAITEVGCCEVEARCAVVELPGARLSTSGPRQSSHRSGHERAYRQWADRAQHRAADRKHDLRLSGPR